MIAGIVEDPIRDGRAFLKEVTQNEEIFLRLAPSEPSAASLEIFIDGNHQVTCIAGSENGFPYEIYSKDRSELLNEIRGLAQAIVEGRYSELVNDGGDKTKAIASWQDGDHLRRPRYNVLKSPRQGDPDWRVITYTPY